MRSLLCFCAFLITSILGFGDYQPKDFSYLFGHIKGLDDSVIKMHLTLYQGYVKNTNLLLAEIERLRKEDKANSLTFGALKRRVGWEMDGMLLHELYFSNLGPSNHTLSPKSSLSKAISRDFGSFEAWKKDFIATGLMRGIGWVILYQDPKEGRLQNIWIEEHDLGHIAGGTPLLVMDVWEHAYITQFGLNRAEYIKIFFENIDWKVVEERLKS